MDASSKAPVFFLCACCGQLAPADAVALATTRGTYCARPQCQERGAHAAREELRREVAS